jgi:hypothetical protein
MGSHRMTEPTTVRITLREIYDAVVELKSIVSNHPDKIDDHEKRIRNLEMRVWSFAGVASFVSVIASYLISKLA